MRSPRLGGLEVCVFVLRFLFVVVFFLGGGLRGLGFL